MKHLITAFIFFFVFMPDKGYKCSDYDFTNAIKMSMDQEEVRQVCVERNSGIRTGLFTEDEWKKIRGKKR